MGIFKKLEPTGNSGGCSTAPNNVWQIFDLVRTPTTSLVGYLRVAGMLFLIYVLYLITNNLYRYRSSIKKRLQEIEADFQRGLVYRSTDTPVNKNGNKNADSIPPGKVVRCLELNPEFKLLHEKDWRLVSLGEYLSSLRLLSSTGNADIPRFIEREIEATVGGILLQNLGPRVGAAVLPILGFGNIQSTVAQIASRLTSWFAAHLLVEAAENSDDPTTDRGALPFSMAEMATFANLNAKRGGSNMKVSSIELFRRGEVGYVPSFGHEDKSDREELNSTPDEDGGTENDPAIDDDSNLIPNPFIISSHWEAAIERLEKKTNEMDSYTDTSAAPASEPVQVSKEYDPEDMSLPEPTPINERILPGLHLGWGDAKCTHTKREIIRNRLLAVLLNKLSHNYHVIEQKSGVDNKNLFVVKMKRTSKECRQPGAFVEELVRCGHSVEVVPRQTITTFGMAACIKESDGSWSNVPIAFFFRTGYDRSDGRPAHFAAPHGGLDLTLKGPLVPKRQDGSDGRCDIQYYMAIEGLCGWHSNHNAQVPWLEAHAPSPVYSESESIRAVRLAGLLACTFNSIGTEMELPFGGYGALGVCNDTAAMVDYAVRGSTNLYPLISTGRFLMHVSRRCLRLYITLVEKECTEEAKDMRALMSAVCNMESDIHTSPSQLIAASKRFHLCHPKIAHFQLSQESKEILSSMEKMCKEFLQWTPDISNTAVEQAPIPKAIFEAFSAGSPNKKSKGNSR